MGKEASSLLLVKICTQIGIDPAGLEEKHLDELADALYGEATAFVGAARALLLINIIKHLKKPPSMRLIRKEPSLEEEVLSQITEAMTKEITREFTRQLTEESVVSGSSGILKDYSANEITDQINRNLEGYLSEEFTFNNFIVCGENEEAFKTSQRLAEGNRTDFRPIYLWGPSASGKTHLIHAIAHKIRWDRKQDIVVNIANFTKLRRDLDEAVETSSEDGIFAFYTEADVLLLDGFHEMLHDPTVEGDYFLFESHFFLMFEQFLAEGGQLVITADRPYTELPQLQESWKTIFQFAEVVELSYLRPGARMEILEKLAESRGWEVDPQIVRAVALAMTTNIRELKRGLTRVIMYAHMSNQEPTLELVYSFLKMQEEA